MRRREFIRLLGGAAVAFPTAAWAQQPSNPLIGFLSGGSQKSDALRLAAFRGGLIESGYLADRNITFEYRWAEGHYDRLGALAADLVRHQVTMIAVIGGTPVALAAKAASTTVPIVFVISATFASSSERSAIGV